MTAKARTASKSRAAKTARPRPFPPDVPFSILTEAECEQLQGVKMSTVELSESGLYAVAVTHDKDGVPSGFEVKPYVTEEA